MTSAIWMQKQRVQKIKDDLFKFKEIRVFIIVTAKNEFKRVKNEDMLQNRLLPLIYQEPVN